MTTAVQRAIDAKRYPPTMQYDVATLKPRGPLRERLDVILGVCPTFFQADSFLDVGCSKGFFSLRAALESRYVLAVDPDASALATWAPVCPANVEQRVGTFADLPTSLLYDMIWVGNGPHYLYREDPQWTERLRAIATDRVLLEGPTHRVREMANFGPVQDEAEMLGALRLAGFRLIARAESPSYTPGRVVWYLRTR